MLIAGKGLGNVVGRYPKIERFSDGLCLVWTWDDTS